MLSRTLEMIQCLFRRFLAVCLFWRNICLFLSLSYVHARSVVSHSLRPRGLQPARLLHP